MTVRGWKKTYLVVVLGTGLLVLGLDLGELDLHVVVAIGQQGLSRGRSQRRRREEKKRTKVGKGKYTRIGGTEGKILTTQRSSSGHRQPSLRR